MRFKQFLLFLFLILIPLLIGAYSPETVRVSRNVVTSLAEPFLEATARTRIWFRSQKNFLLELFRTRGENKQLTERIQELEQELTLLQEEKQENVRLKKLLKFQQTNQKRTVSAQIIARDISHWTYYAVINKGTADGIRSEMAVVTGEGLVGKVVNATAHSARIILLIDSESRVSALVQETRDVGLVEGTGSPFLRMSYIDLHAQIGVGQAIISSGFGGIYPKGIPIGEIVQIGEDKGELGLYAVVKPLVLFSKLEEVLCLAPE